MAKDNDRTATLPPEYEKLFEERTALIVAKLLQQAGNGAAGPPSVASNGAARACPVPEQVRLAIEEYARLKARLLTPLFRWSFPGST